MKKFVLCLLLLVVSAKVEAAELLIFTADWCGPCRRVKKDIKDAPEIVTGYEWGYVDFDEEETLVKMYDVHEIPTFLILEGVEVRGRLTGYPGPETLKNWLKNRPNKQFVR